MEGLSKEITLIDPIVIDQNHRITAIRLEIKHDKGGFSYGTGEYHNTGVILNLTPICRDPRYPNSYSVLYDGKTEHQGFFVHLIECQRKSPKKMQAAADKVLPLGEEIKKLFLEGKYVEIANLVVNATKGL